MGYRAIERSIGNLFYAALLFFSASAVSIAEEATFDGVVVKIPVAVIFDEQYRLELTLIPDSNPFTFNLTGATVITGFNTSGASMFAGNTLTIPSLQFGDASYRIDLVLSNNNPVQLQLGDFGVNEPDEKSAKLRAEAFELFANEVATPVINTRCIVCHVEGGLARDTALTYERVSPASIQNNFERISSFLATRPEGVDYILSKVTGNNHVGGIQLPEGTAQYTSFRDFLLTLNDSFGNVGNSTAKVDFFKGTALLSKAATLRRAAIMLASRLPTEAELASVESATEESFRDVLRGLMQGDGFHQFLLEGVNDRLLVEGVPSNVVLDDRRQYYPAYANDQYKLRQYEVQTGQRGLAYARILKVDEGMKKSPGELVAYVVENDRPYTEILTADYVMMNPDSNAALDGTAVFNDPTDSTEFQPGQIKGYYRNVPTKVSEHDVNIGVFTSIFGDGQIDPPNAGILTTMAFLKRYPTTATNRNRARARWTFFHFLDIDIERSSQRPTDPDALADKNNPTMKNPNCTACHATMDPVAGAFQNWNEEGIFKGSWGGLDSLDNDYKHPKDGASTAYQPGDTWYREMRAPGLFDTKIQNTDTTLQELARYIVKEPAFAEAAVKFWWPSVFGSKVLRAPAVVEDAFYQTHLLAYEAQSRAIEGFATSFRSHLNLKELLVDMLASPWFRTVSASSPELDSAHAVAELGVEKLLTPERLHRKTLALTGFSWDTSEWGLKGVKHGLPDIYSLYFGGIDSFGIKERATEITPLMSTVPMSHALESAGPIILREFTLPDSKRKLFAGFSPSITPISMGASTPFIVESANERDFREYSFTTAISPGMRRIGIEFLNAYCDWNETTKTCDDFRQLVVSQIEIKSTTGSFSKTIKATVENVNNPRADQCGSQRGEMEFGIYSSCAIDFLVDIPQQSNYIITARVAAFRGGSELSKFSILLQSGEEPLVSTASGAIAIKQKLVDLHRIFLGKTYALDSAEITLAYQLLVSSWVGAQADGLRPHLFANQALEYWRDLYFGVDIGFGGNPFRYRNQENPNQKFVNWEELQPYLDKPAEDSNYMKHAWRTVLVYLMTHYDYIYE